MKKILLRKIRWITNGHDLELLNNNHLNSKKIYGTSKTSSWNSSLKP